MIKKKNEKDEELIREVLNKVLSEVFAPAKCLDADDYAYILARKYFQIHGYELKGDDIYLNDKKTGVLGDICYDGNKLDLIVKMLNPVHFIAVNIEIKKDEEDGT